MANKNDQLLLINIFLTLVNELIENGRECAN